MDSWDVGFCERLAAAGRFVVRYDHRDTGRSETSPAGQPLYSADDLATDPLRVLDALGIDQAHVVGLSMGGGIAQQLAAQHADRLISLTLMSTSAEGARADQASLPPMERRVAAAFEDPAPEPAWHDRAAVVDFLVDGPGLPARSRRGACHRDTGRGTRAAGGHGPRTAPAIAVGRRRTRDRAAHVALSQTNRRVRPHLLAGPTEYRYIPAVGRLKEAR